MVCTGTMNQDGELVIAEVCRQKDQGHSDKNGGLHRLHFQRCAARLNAVLAQKNSFPLE